MKRKDRKERARLRKQVEWCKMVALDYYIAGDAEKERYWEKEAIAIQRKIMMLYPRFRAFDKVEERRVYVPVFVNEKGMPHDTQAASL